MKKLILLTFLFLVACQPKTDEISILDKSNCKLPCWNGIVVGQTTEDELLYTLENLPDIDTQSINVTNYQSSIRDSHIDFSFRQPWMLSRRPKLQGDVDIVNDFVAGLTICGKINTSMGELVEETGEPEYIISGNNFYGGRTIILFNSKTGISYWYISELDNLEITPNTPIECIFMFDVSLYEEFLDVGYFSNGYYNSEETMKVAYLWDGYGNLDEKYHPRQP